MLLNGFLALCTALIVVGGVIVGPQAGEMIHELMYSVGWEALPSEAAAFIHAHPTLSEAMAEAAHKVIGTPIHGV